MRDIMLVDDETLVLRALKRSLSRVGDWEIECFDNPEDAVRRAQVKTFDVVVSDYRMPQMTGTELLNQIRELQPMSMRIILSGHADRIALVEAINSAEIFRFVGKPWQEDELISALQDACRIRDERMEDRILAAEYRFDNDHGDN